MNGLINFVLLREGTSDEGLLPHLRQLLVRSGAEEAVGTTRDYKGNLEERLSNVHREGVGVSLIFIHRDADSSDSSSRYSEIARATSDDRWDFHCIGVIPIQELEAWLLLDEQSIRDVVGKPSGKSKLELPSLSQVEQTSSPKELLRDALLAASESSGRRYQKQRSLFSQHRRTLLERLDLDGPVRSLSAWRQLEADIAQFITKQES